MSFDLVAFGYRDFAHVVAEARDLKDLRVVPCTGRTQPGRKFLANVFVLPKADDDFSIQTHPARDVAKFAIPVSRLVQVHELHVDGCPGEFSIELSVQMYKRFLQRL